MHNPTCYTRQRWAYPKDEDRNWVAALFHLITIVLVSTSLIQLNWFQVWGGNCTPHLATSQFFGFGAFYATQQNQYHHGLGEFIASNSFIIHYNTSTETLACVTPDIVNLMHMLIILSTMAVISSTVGFCLDIVGPTKQSLKIIRRNAVPSITTVFIVIAIIGTSYFVTKSVEESADFHSLPNVLITYDYGCYVVTAAGSFSILATACSLLQSQSPTDPPPQRHMRLLEDWDTPETFSVGMRSMPLPPPPYTP